MEKKSERAGNFSVVFAVEDTCSAVVQETNDVRDKAETDTGETL